jgi:hypothetical protein
VAEEPSPDFSSYAAECRTAGLAFIGGVAAGWTKRDLAVWLAGPYGALAMRGSSDVSGVVPGLSVHDSQLAGVMHRARQMVIAALLDLKEGEWQAVVEAIKHGAIKATRSNGELVWLPVDRARMRLEARVLSLFLTDYLYTPDAYEGDFGWCPVCDGVYFAAGCPRCDESRNSYVREIATAGNGAAKKPRKAAQG